LRIDGPKLWTLSGFQYKDAVMAVEDSAYGTVVTYPVGQHLGTAHFLDVPGRPGEVEKEQVTALRVELDGRPLKFTGDVMSVSGKRLRVERLSKIRAFDLDSLLIVQDNMLVQSARIRANEPVELQMSYPLMFAWTPTATEHLFGLQDGTAKEGGFNTATTKPSEGLEKSASWMAVYDPPSGSGAVAYLVEKPSNADGWFQYTDAPGIYRKLRLMSFVNTTVPRGFDGTFSMAVGFFSSPPQNWKAVATERVNSLKAAAHKLHRP
jgi:hypothetical protein